MPEKPSFASEYRKEQAELVRQTCLCHYVIRNYGTGIDDVLAHLKPVLDEQETQKALQILLRDFSDPGGVGPRRVAEFLYHAHNDELQADVAGFVRELLRKCDIT
jgi:hypothetical protein